MKINEAIQATAEHFRATGDLSPSHCDVRCAVNDLVSNDPQISRKGYDQTRAWQQVRRALGNPVRREETAYYRR